MTATKEHYQISATDINGLMLRLNSVLARISDRLDKIEGIRGELETKSGTFSDDVTSVGVIVNDADGNKIHSIE